VFTLINISDMQTIEERISNAVIQGVKTLYGADINTSMVQLGATRKEFEGQLTLVVFPFLKASHKGPEQTAQDLGNYLHENLADVVADFNVVKGFLNLVIANKYWVELLQEISNTPQFGFLPVTDNSPLVMIE